MRKLFSVGALLAASSLGLWEPSEAMARERGRVVVVYGHHHHRHWYRHHRDYYYYR